MEKKMKMLFALTLAALAVVACAFIVFNDDGAVAADNIIDVSTEKDLSDAVMDLNNAKKTIRLANDIEVTKTIVVNQKITIDLNDNKLFNTSDIWNEGTGNWSLISVRGNGDLTIKGDGSLEAKENDCYAIDLRDKDTKCTINDGHYIGNICAVYVYGGKLVINNGEFKIQQLSTISGEYEFVINCYDAFYKSGIATVTINGGIYHGFNPQNNASEGTGTNHISADYAVIESTDVSPHKYTVVEAVAKIDNMGYPTLEAAISAVKSDETTITLQCDVTDGSGIIVNSGKKFTLDFNGHSYTVTNNLAGSTGTKSQAFQLLKDSTIVMKNGAIIGNSEGVTMLIQNYCNLTLENMRLDATKGTNSVSYVLSNNNGEVNIIGSTSIIAKDGKFAFDACWAPNKGYPNGTQLNINTTGEIIGTVQYDLWGANASPIKTKLTIDSGTFIGTIDVENVFKYDDVKKLIAINGGSFSDLSGLAYVAEGKTYNLVEDCVVKSDVTVKEKTILSVADGKSITIDVGKKLTIQNGASFNGTILGPNSNKLVANGMKAGDDGITITGGSLIINGKIMDAGGSEAGVTVTVTGDGIKISGSLDANATMVIEEGTVVTVEGTFASKGSVNNNGIIDNKGTITNDGVLTNDGTIKMTGASEIKTTVVNNKVVNNGVVIDERAKDAIAVPVTNDGTVVAKNNADKYKDAKIDVVEQDPDKPVATEGKIEVNTNKYAFITPITTTGKLNIVMNDGYKQYTVTIPEGTVIAAGTVISVSFIEYQSDSVTRYQINTPGIENFSMKLPCQIGFKKAKVYCDDSELGVSKVRYDAGTGYVTFDAAHNSVFTIVLSNVSPAGTTTVSGGDAANDYSLVIAITVLVASLGFLAYVIRKK